MTITFQTKINEEPLNGKIIDIIDNSPWLGWRSGMVQIEGSLNLFSIDQPIKNLFFTNKRKLITDPSILKRIELSFIQ